MKIFFQLFVLTVGFTHSIASYGLELSVHAELPPEMEFHYLYELSCDSEQANAFPGMVAEANFRGRTIRFYLFSYLNAGSFSLGTHDAVSANEVSIQFLPSSACRLSNFQPTLVNQTLDPDQMASIAKAHSPYLMIRKDQLAVPERDVHLGIAYSIMPKSNGFSIRYTYFFSNETVSGLFSTSKATSLGSWGRRSDVEWVYQVDFGKDGKVISQHYQGGLIFGLGHKTKTFKGHYLTGTLHPILYDIASHNVFGENPAGGNYVYRQVGVHAIPEEEIKAPLSRESWLWNRPWTFDITDRELARDRKLSFPSNEYIYADLSGALNGGKIQVSAVATGSKFVILAGDGKPTLKSLGDDLWGQESFSAIHIDAKTLAAHGHLHIKRSTAKTALSPPRFFSLTRDEKLGFRTEELTAQFSCSTAYDCDY